MSNYLAVATVTAVITQLIRDALIADVTGSDIVFGRPVDPATRSNGSPEVRIFLYRVATNGALSNIDLPTRNSDGSLLQRPSVALNLFYILTFYGDENTLEPQRMMGSVVRTLNATPVVSRQVIEATLVNPTFSFLANSDLAEALETVKISQTPLSLEELSRLWSVFFQVPYSLSLAYQAQMVLIESDLAPRSGLPVKQRNVYVFPFRQPAIDRILSRRSPGEPVLPDQPILPGQILVLSGKRLSSEIVKVQVGDTEIVPASPDISSKRIEIPLTSPPFPANRPRAGIVAVQVIHEMAMGTPSVPHRGEASNVAAFVLRPSIQSVNVANVQGSGSSPRTADVTLAVTPEIGARQRVALFMNQINVDNPAAYTFWATPPPADTGSITIAISGVVAGNYLVRIQVDGAESTLTADTDPASPTFNQYIAPRVTIP